jgi:hypothetical protein
MTDHDRDQDGVIGAHLTPTEARQGIATGRVRTILAISLTLTVIGMVIVWATIR